MAPADRSEPCHQPGREPGQAALASQAGSAGARDRLTIAPDRLATARQQLPPGWRLEAHATAEAAAAAVASLLLRQRLTSPRRVLGLATGRTMEPVYAALAGQVSRLDGPVRQSLRTNWTSFNLDEYVGLTAGDPGSFQAFMAQHLVRPLGLEAGRVLLPDGGASDPEREARRYATALADAGGLDLQLLGLGLNGHVGFNEPPCAADVRCRCVPLTASTRQANALAFGGDPASVPAAAITLGLREILAASSLLLLVTGASKAQVLRRLLLEPAGPLLPASWLRGHPDLTLIVDEAALAWPGSLPEG